jgi:hypothetical protein
MPRGPRGEKRVASMSPKVVALAVWLVVVAFFGGIGGSFIAPLSGRATDSQECSMTDAVRSERPELSLC